MSILPFSPTAFFGHFRVFFCRLFKGVSLLLGWVICPEGLHKIDRLRRHWPNSLSSSVQVHLSHGWFVGIFEATVETIVCGLEGHLYECIGRITSRGHEILSIV